MSRPKIGKLRPSQAVTQHGPGAIVDLPELSVIMAGIDHWDPVEDDRVDEPRLAKFLNVDDLFAPPRPGAGRFGGLPSFIFPEYLVCPHANCRRLAHHRSFGRVGRADSLHFECLNHAKHDGRQTAFPARFLVACPRGHVDDFPWHSWVHHGAGDCRGELRLTDSGRTGGATDISVRCDGCGKSRTMAGAFRAGAHSSCSGRQPWLGPNDRAAGCTERPRTLLRGASNAFFSVVASALSIPPWSDPIHQEVARYRQVLSGADSLEHLRNGVQQGYFRNLGPLLDRYTLEEIWAAHTGEPGEENLKSREWEAFIDPSRPVPPGSEFEIAPRAVPLQYRGRIDQVVAATRLREVRALRGFMRIDPIPDAGESDDVAALSARMAAISRDPDVGWLPAVDLRGEGIFIRFDEESVRRWEESGPVASERARLEKQWTDWRSERGLEEKPFPGIRLVLIHTFSHALIRQLSLDSGYSSSSIRERLFVSEDRDNPMAGVLLYTASSDSDGSLGGLVDQAKADRFGPLIMNALRDAEICAQDPLCGGRDSGSSSALNGSACHACLLIAETSCEMANRLLDRGTIVATLGGRGLEYFTG